MKEELRVDKSSSEKDPAVLGDCKLNMSQLGEVVAKRADVVLGYIEKGVGPRARE